MSTQTQSATEIAIDRIYELIRKIIEKSGNGNCIYRGEPEHYDNVSSALYRPFPSEFDSGEYDLEGFNQDNLEVARNHINDQEKEDFELLTELQHYGDQTNLIDFTTDFHIALFFACNGFHDKDGRIIVLQRSEEIDGKYEVDRPSKPLNRVKAQKSILTQPQKGFIDPEDFDTVTVPANLKQWILIHLLKFQDISIQSIYSDLHGFISNKKLRYSHEAIFPLVFAERKLEHIADKDQPVEDEEEKDAWRDMIAGYTKRIEYSPYEAQCYVKQGEYYHKLREYDCVIEACSKAILLQPDYLEAYNSRGYAFFSKKDYVNAIEDFDYIILQDNPDNAKVHLAHVFKGLAALHMQDWEKAKSGFEAQKVRSVTIFRTIYESVSDFEQKYNVKLPADIVEILTPTQ
jgi:hypothetical protein